VIELRDVRKRYGARGPEALRGVSLTVPAGETLAVIGPNGAGKSTLLALALGFLRPTGGTIRIDGLDPRAFVRRRGAGWLPERFQLPAAWKVRSSLEHFARLGGDRAGAAREALAHFGLEAQAGRQTSELSYGQSRRLALALAMLSPRALVVLDEPTDGLDAEGRERFRERVAWLRANGATLVLASHDLAEMERIADRAAGLENGVRCDVAPLRPAPESSP
jgi:ABC-2 type transport system ATP-binding protein